MITKLVLVALAVCLVVMVQPVFAQEKTGTLEVFIKNESNDRSPPEGMAIKIYEGQQKTPIQQIQSLESNPFTVSLSLGHSYRIEVYANDMLAETGFVDMKQSQQRTDITIKNAGGIRLSIYYNDGDTPLQNAKVWIKSKDKNNWSYSETDENGQTIRSWLYPTLKDDYYYIAEISLGPNLVFTYSPIKIQPTISQELKIVTNWPKIIDKLITVEVYNSTKSKIVKEDGQFVAQLYDPKKNKIAESDVSFNGIAHFSNLKVNTYALYIEAKDSSGVLKTVAAKKLTITDATNTIKIYLNNPELNSDYLNCNCVAFRLDDIQDYFLNGAQTEILKLFEQKQASLTIGIIANVFGDDRKVVDLVKSALDDKDFDMEVANHSWTHRLMPTLTKSEQEDDIEKSNKKIHDVLGVTPTTFIPPENLYNNDTIAVLKQNNFTQISYHTATSQPPPFKKSDFYHFPATTQTSILNRQEANWNVQSIDKVYDEINDSLLNYGYAVVMMHPHEFSTYSDGIYQNKVNQTNVQQLGLLIDKVRNEGLKIVTINEISSFDKPVPKKQTSANTTSKAVNCNCVAFRLDNIQDFYLNDVQNAIIDNFDEKKSPLTISIIGKFFGTDPKTTNFIKEKIDGGSHITVANRGWEYLDHTAYDEQKQAASIQKTNDQISQILGVKSVMFVPPLDSFNKDTILAASQNHMLFFSSSVVRDPPPYSDSLKHMPSTSQFVSLVDDDPFYSGTIPQKAQAKIKSSIEKYGYAVISLQPQDFATKNADNTSKNEINANMLRLLSTIIDDLKSNGVNIVDLETIPSILEEKSIVIPSWVQENAGWWADDKITDSDFTKGLQYLIDQKIVKIPSTQAGNGTAQKMPSWIKNNAGWWAEGKIGNSDFVKGIQYLIANGIIRI